MRFKINIASKRKEQEKEDKKPQQKIDFELKLDQEENGDVILMAVDKDGNKIKGGNILALSSDGYLVLPGGINPALGLQLDEVGVIECRTTVPKELQFIAALKKAAERAESND